MKLIIVLFFLIFSDGAVGQTLNTSSSRKFSFGISFSPDYSYRRLQSDEDDHGIIESRNEYESPRFGFTSGITSHYFLTSKFALESGLQFSNKTYKYKITSNDFVVLDGSSLEDDPAIPQKETTNYHYYLLGVPVKLNYYVLRKDVKLFLSVGVSTDFFMDGKSKTELEFSDRTETGTNQMEDVDFNKVNFTGLAGFGVEKDISNSLQFRLEPIFRYSFTPLVDAPLKGYLYSFGANFTLFYH